MRTDLTRAEIDDESPAVPSAAGYRPHLDGLRAVAVYLVVAFHAGSGRLSGGFVGVDIFFVLSGYLVTQLLIRDLDDKGRIRFRYFYSRRIRRLLPAAVVALVVTGIVYAAIATPAELDDAADAIRAAFLYVSNWFFIGQSNNYFAADFNASPVIHFWSLSIEEQFYALWPLILAGLFLVTARTGRHRLTLVRATVATFALISVIAALRIADTDLNRAYYGTDTRAYQLLAGALLALTPAAVRVLAGRRRVVPLLAVASLGTLVVMASSAVSVNAIERGAIVTVATCVLLLVMDAGDRSAVTRGLSLPALTYLGRISYGTYLWHWPVIVVAVHGFDPSSASLFAISAVVATGLASLSFQLIERPIRLGRLLDRRRTLVIAAGVAMSVLGVLFVPAALRDRDESVPIAAAKPSGGGAHVQDLDWQGARDDDSPAPVCNDDPTACTVVRGSGPHIALVGDSHARMLIPALTAVARRASLTLTVLSSSGCPWQLGLTHRAETRRLTPGEGAAERRAECVAQQARWYDEMIPALQPDIVMFANRAYDDATEPHELTLPNGRRVAFGTEEYAAGFRAATEETLERVRGQGRQIVVVEPIPITSSLFNPIACLSSARSLDECRYVANERPLGIENYYRTVDAEDGALFSLDLDSLVCPFLPICDPVVDGMIVKRDSTHITATYSQTLGVPILGYLRDNGVLPD